MSRRESFLSHIPQPPLIAHAYFTAHPEKGEHLHVSMLSALMHHVNLWLTSHADQSRSSTDTCNRTCCASNPWTESSGLHNSAQQPLIFGDRSGGAQPATRDLACAE
ncbi:hypothetical protein DUNSADRAFT_9972 [Dunaliella salina]|uniref:Encoded protein n=1 Tax=Dunaliella salina TaxID=3046 RepID=A0ABQ7GGD2_DUNSA|nr:hypothetical protein DUNSADRAFT_9972 [Dunaliella salina]|eukprot:KAF5833662.1 hypothetical protein DUNSADRAFT_9972 [Dunaliella salina]